MSNLKPSMVGLDKGLNLQVAKIVAPQGSLLSMLNYEQVDFQGQKRIDGFTRYDGSLLSAVDTYYVIETDVSLAASSGLCASDDGYFGRFINYPGPGAGNKYIVAIANELRIPAVGQNFNVLDSTGGTIVETVVVTSVAESAEVEPDEATQYNNLLTLNTYLRSIVEELPGPVAGLHWFRDRLLAIAGVTYASIEGTSPVIYPGDVLVCDGNTATVLDAFTLGNTRAIFLDTTVPGPWTTEGNDVTRSAVSVGAIANGYQELGMDEIASIFESRTEQQVLDEDGPTGPYDFGWRFRHLGWRVLFENGITLFGSLPSINQNIEGIGTQGPTSITGNNGAAATVNQGVDVTNVGTQVNGWKDSDASTSYALNAAAIQYADTRTIYADAYLSWDGATGAVQGDTGVLVEYSPVNTVEVDI